MAISINTQLNTSLNGFAKFFGLNPFYFNFLDPSCIYPISDLCLEFWSQNTWNSTSGLSIELLSQLLYEAELEIMQYYGLSLDQWITDEYHHYPIDLRHGNLIAPYLYDAVFKSDYRIDYFGQRKFTLLTTANLTYLDHDNDGYSEAARITYTIPTGKNIANIRFFYPGNTEYEIKDYKVISIVSNVATIEFTAWDLITLETILSTKFKNNKAHSLCDTDIYLDTISVGFEEKDICLPDIKLFYRDNICEGGCDYDHIPACGVKVSDKLFKISLQSYDTDGCIIANNSPVLCNTIDYITVNYHTSAVNNTLLQHAIYYLAASRFPLQGCQCDCVKNIFSILQRDTRLKEKNAGNYATFNTDYLSPFGAKIGELKAYGILENLI